MTVKELKKIIQDLPDEMPVCCNDFLGDVFEAETATVENNNYVKTNGADVKGEYLSINY